MVTDCHLQALVEVWNWYCGSIEVRSSLPTACREGAGSVAIIGLRRCQQPAQRLVTNKFQEHACVCVIVKQFILEQMLAAQVLLL